MNNKFTDLTALASLAKERYPLKTMELKSVIFGLSLGVAGMLIGWSLDQQRRKNRPPTRGDIILSYTNNYPIQEETSDDAHTGVHSPVTGYV